MATTKPKPEQPTANAERGEHELTLEGVTYRLRPSFSAIIAIEKKTASTLIALVNDGNRGALSLEHLGIVAAELIKAGADDDATRNVGAARIGELIYEQGVPTATARITTCLIDAVTGGRTAEGEVRAIAE